MLVEILQGSDGSSGVEVGLGHAAVGELDGVLVLPLVAVLKRRNALEMNALDIIEIPATINRECLFPLIPAKHLSPGALPGIQNTRTQALFTRHILKLSKSAYKCSTFYAHFNDH